MISIAKKFIFIHIPKTGGTSIKSVLSKYQHRIPGLHGHHHLDDPHLVDPPIDQYVEDCFSFACVRNPWERMLSWFFWIRDRNNLPFDTVEFIAYLNDFFKRWHYTYRQQVDFIKPGVDYLMRYENIDKDFKKVCEIIDVPLVYLPKKNSSSNNGVDYHDYYNQEALDVIAKECAEDIKYLNYDY